MSEPRRITEADLAYWADLSPVVKVFTAPEEIGAVVEPCEAIVTAPTDQFGTCVRVPVVLNEIEMMHLVHGGTLWLSTWGGLPMWMIEVQERIA